MKMKRFLAILLVLAMCLTTLGVVPAMAVEPAAEESDDAISARWTDKNSLFPADQEITPHEVEGEIPSADGVDLSNDENALKASDIVTVIVELESEPLADAAMGELDTFISSPACLQLEQDLLNEQASVRAEIEALTGKTETASVNGASDLTYSYTTVLNGFSMKLPYGKLDEVRSLNGVKNVWVAEQYSLPEDLSADDYTISMNSSTGMVGSTEANAMGYDGTGTIVAILDTGFMKAHEAFSVMPTDTKYSRDDIASLLQSQSLASKVTDADSVYINEKAPYGYDYANGDADPEAIGQAHGVHVAGTVAGNNGKDFHGVAPNAQLMIMKIFADNSGSTSDDIILAGIDEQNNIDWSERLEEAGCKVLYGFEDYKVHSKICLITLRERGALRHVTQIGTGNYNEKTAKQYTDVSLVTADQNIGADAAAFFSNMALGNLEGSYGTLLVAPHQLKKPILARIEEQTALGPNGYILMKFNSLTDIDVIHALSRASQAGVRVELIIRGICCLAPGVPGYTDNITVTSIVGRFLEHSRIFCFGRGEQEHVYISSADMMTRNTVRRVEIACPIRSPEIRRRLHEILDAMLADTVKARVLLPDGTYTKKPPAYEPVCAQVLLMKRAVEAAQQQSAAAPQEKRSLWEKLFHRKGR